MSLVTVIGEMLKSGKVTVSVGNVEAVQVTAENKKIDITAIDKTIVKDVLAAAREEKSKGLLDQISTARSSLGMLKGVAEELSEAGMTVTLSYKDSVVVTMGCEAKPKLSSILTGTKAIEVNDPKKLVELGI